MESPERPAETQILGWLRLYDLEGCLSWQARARAASLPTVARILWLRYCAEPPWGTRAIADEHGLHVTYVSQLTRRGLGLLAAAEEQGDLPGSWSPDSPLGRVVIWWRLQHRPFIPRPRS